jgi:hypothetical protein
MIEFSFFESCACPGSLRSGRPGMMGCLKLKFERADILRPFSATHHTTFWNHCEVGICFRQIFSEHESNLGRIFCASCEAAGRPRSAIQTYARMRILLECALRASSSRRLASGLPLPGDSRAGLPSFPAIRAPGTCFFLQCAHRGWKQFIKSVSRKFRRISGSPSFLPARGKAAGQIFHAPKGLTFFQAIRCRSGRARS